MVRNYFRHSSTTLLFTAILLEVVLGQSPTNPVVQARLVVRQGIEAYQKKNYSQSLDLFLQAHKLRPDHPGLVYNLAVCHALLGNAENALTLLGKVASMGLVYHPERDSDFASICADKRFADLQQRFQRNAKPVGTIKTAFQLHDRELIPEGIAYDEADASFYVSSVRKKKILRIGPDGEQEDFSTPADSLWAAMGLALDARRRELWVATSALPQMEGFREELRERAAIVQYDLQTGALAQRWEIPDNAKGHIIGDLTVNRRGDVFATDSQTPSIYRITGGTLELYRTSEEFGSLQGITFSDDERLLYVADYSRGIFVIDVATKHVKLLGPLSGNTLLSIDGLYYYRHSLVATQNDITPNRVVRLSLSADGQSLTGLSILSANNPYTDEPTLGVVAGEEFFFHGNSQWKNFNARGEARSDAVWEAHRIMKTSLQ